MRIYLFLPKNFLSFKYKIIVLLYVHLLGLFDCRLLSDVLIRIINSLLNDSYISCIINIIYNNGIRLSTNL
jgi:hypothetical protein